MNTYLTFVKLEMELQDWFTAPPPLHSKLAISFYRAYPVSHISPQGNLLSKKIQHTFTHTHPQLFPPLIIISILPHYLRIALYPFLQYQTPFALPGRGRIKSMTVPIGTSPGCGTIGKIIRLYISSRYLV